MKRLLIEIAIFLSLCITISVLYNKYQHQKEEAQRQSANVGVLTSDIKRYKVNDSLNAVSLTALRFNVDELNKYKTDAENTIKELKLKPSRVEYITKTVTVTKDSIHFVLKDSCINYKDKWLEVYGCIGGKLSILSTDSITSIIHREYKHKFLWWKWGTKGYKQEIINYNPHSEIKYSEFIKVEK